ncbi:uncharacterized protein [Haliotis asinina]|uniref:uncharacterized protein n=1 Tax=Haliotis asinina TaxID=109174 RepID=UPI0035319693
MTSVYLYFVVFVPGIFCVNPCPPGLYGELCDKHCNVNCRAHVNKERYCDKDTGDCSLSCVSGRWGSQCNFPCSKNCVDRVCFQQTGQCTNGCTENYRGYLCEEYIGKITKFISTETPTEDPPERTQSHKQDTTLPILTLSLIIVIVIAFVIVIVVRILKQVLATGKWRTDLHDASYWGDVFRVKKILSEGQVDINCVDTYGRTPLMWAVHQNQKDVFDVLVSKGASLSLTDKSGNNILHFACLGGHKDIVQNILSKETVDINSKDRYDRTAVNMAERNGYIDVVDLLVRNGADLSLQDKMETHFSREPLL